MYSTVTKYQQTIIGSISQQDVNEYEWLLNNVRQASTVSYQQKYRNFWVMNRARLRSGFYATYFGALNAARTQGPMLSNLCQSLYQSSTRSNGQQSLQFSFATKLLHVASPQLPIYDSHVVRFYLFQEPDTKQSLQARINSLIAFHDFLIKEYARVINSGQLASAIAAFRQRFSPQHHTDEKIIDWLIWGFVGVADGGALLNSRIAYV
jgi:hypothetical protein